MILGRGLRDLLVINLFNFGGSSVLTAGERWIGRDGFIGLPGFAAGAAVVSGAQQTGVFCGVLGAVPPGQVDAGRVLGLTRTAVGLPIRSSDYG